MHHLQYLRRRGIRMETSSHCQTASVVLGKRGTRQARVACHWAISSIVATSRLNDVDPVAYFANPHGHLSRVLASPQLSDLQLCPQRVSHTRLIMFVHLRVNWQQYRIVLRELGLLQIAALLPVGYGARGAST